ncbi:methyltransferase domain-containing protein [Micromonospora sp. NPDC050495]|uniref:methyltransferase domain-containing protein n=1 Tax=Micromonospora sp. NPDC050495 TaxID=3154936 RepID=UPI0033FD5F50
MPATLDEVHLRHLRELCARRVMIDDEGLRLGDTYVMFFAESALMAEHAAALLGGQHEAHVLEIGLGLGVFAQQIAPLRPARYTAVEPHPAVVDLVAPRVREHLPCPVVVVVEPWQVLDLEPESIDAIMYDTWPPDGQADADFASFVERVAIRVLRPGGRFSFFHSGTQLPKSRADVLDRFFADWSVMKVTIPANRLPSGWTKPTGDFLVPCARKGVQ